MGLETRIGVVVGLVIVVVASVYFFYGSSHEVDEVFLPASPRIAAAPKIPQNGLPPAPTRSLVDRVQIPPREALRPSVNPAINVTPAPAGQQVAPPSVASAQRPRGAIPESRTSTPLRTSPSEELVGATWDNLTKSAQPAPTPGATQSGSAQMATGQKPVADVPAKKLHRVRPGDTLSGIAKEYLGAGGSSDAILKANPQLKRGRSLKIGEMLFIPEKAVPAVASAAKSLTAQSAAAPNAAAATYQVRDGDTFYSIAKDVYGDSSKWGELYRLNRALVKGDPKRLKPGMVLKLLK